MTIYPGAWLQNCKNIQGPNRKYSFECWNSVVALFIVSFKKLFSAVKGSACVSSGAAPITGHVSRHHVHRLLLCCWKTSASSGYKSQRKDLAKRKRKRRKVRDKGDYTKEEERDSKEKEKKTRGDRRERKGKQREGKVDRSFKGR